MFKAKELWHMSTYFCAQVAVLPKATATSALGQGQGEAWHTHESVYT